MPSVKIEQLLVLSLDIRRDVANRLDNARSAES